MTTKPHNFRIPDHEIALWRAACASMAQRLGVSVSLTSWLRAVAEVAARAELNGVDLAGRTFTVYPPTVETAVERMPAPSGDAVPLLDDLFRVAADAPPNAASLDAQVVTTTTW